MKHTIQYKHNIKYNNKICYYILKYNNKIYHCIYYIITQTIYVETIRESSSERNEKPEKKKKKGKCGRIFAKTIQIRISDVNMKIVMQQRLRKMTMS